MQREVDALPLRFPCGATPFDPTAAKLRFEIELPELPAGQRASSDSFVTDGANDGAARHLFRYAATR